MKTKFLTTFILSAFILASCSSDNDSLGTNDNEVRFTGAISAQPDMSKAANASWDAGDAIGVYMLNAGTSVISGGEANKKYITATTAGNFAATGSDIIHYPSVGSVDFVAYYPYNNTLTSTPQYPVNVATQTSQPAIDLLYSNNATNKNKTNTTVALNFSHKLTKLVLNVQAGTGMGSLAGLTVKIKGMDTEADFNLATGNMITSSYSSPADIVPAGSGTTFEAILLPVSAVSAAQKVEFTVGGSTYTWQINNNITSFDAGMKYNYTITINRTALGGITGNITDWINVPGTGTAE